MEVLATHPEPGGRRKAAAEFTPGLQFDQEICLLRGPGILTRVPSSSWIRMRYICYFWSCPPALNVAQNA